MVDIETPPSDGADDPGRIDGDGDGLGLTPLGLLIAEGLERLDADGDEAFEDFCREHPEHADEIVANVRVLVGTGLAGSGRRLGHYRILRPLGRGGMGVVYLAEDTRLSRVVALKALPSQLVQSERALERFRRETRAVASLRHPCIVPVYDVGEDDGQPYFTMEFVEGRTLDAVIASLRGLEISADKLDSTDLGRATFLAAVERESDEPLPKTADDDVPVVTLPREWGRAYVQAICRLVLDVADALEHAHRHGIVHRDVKPSNILVSQDGRAQLFDFGLAHTESNSSLTMTGDFTGTPYYVSPEQAHGDETDARTDVYSLGVTLYELLTLTRPFEGRTNHEVFKRIHGNEPASPRKRNPSVPRDLETICLTALEKDPARRYPSAAEMAADLLRFLDYQPLHVRPVGTLTRVGRWMRRNPAAATAAALALFVVLATPIALAIHNRVLGHAHDQLATSYDTLAKADRINTIVNRFLLDIFRSADPSVRGANVTVAEMLDEASTMATEKFADEPEVEVALRKALGHSYEGLGRFDAALAEYERVLELRRAEHASDHRDVCAALGDVGVVLARRGRDAEAREMLDAALAMAERLGADIAGHEHADALFNLAMLDYSLGEGEAAEVSAAAALGLREAWLEHFERSAGDVDPEQALRAREDVASSRVLLGNLARQRRLYDVAEEHYRAALDVLGERLSTSVRTAAARSELAALYLGTEQGDKAVALFEEALEASRARRGAEHVATLNLQIDLARALWSVGRLDEALVVIETVSDTLATRGGDALAGRALLQHAHVLFELGDARAAAARALAAHGRLSRAHPAASFTVIDATVALADMLSAAEREDEAIAVLEALEPDVRRAYGAGHWTVTACLTRMVALYEAAGRRAEADTARAWLDASVSTSR